MDIFAHVVWTNLAAKSGNAVAEKKEKKFHIDPIWTAFFGVAPDFFAFTAPFIIGVFSIISGKSSFSSFGPRSVEATGFDLAAYLYQFSHSLVIFLLVFILVWVVSRRPRWELLGWALHIFIDIPSHAISFYPTPFLFPVSEYRFPYGVQWSNQWFMIINYSLMLVAWGVFLFFKYRNKKQEVK
jgi:fumarate reductase subunit D